MNSKEKAKDIYNKFHKLNSFNPSTPFIKNAKNSSLICVYEILIFIDERKEGYKYWKQVKQEIENYE